jgi:PKD repeat protein
MLINTWPKPSAAFTAHVTSGTAPLAVHFNAKASTGGWGVTNPFLQLDYQWDFDDAGAGQWTTYGYTHSINSKETGFGPVIGHVFESAGTYVVSLTVEDAQGQTSTTTETINVTAANSTFSGTDTICVSTGGDFTGAPAGANCVCTSAIHTNLPSGATTTTDALAGTYERVQSTYLASGKRVLLKAGETWTRTGQLTANDINITSGSPWHFGSFGTANDGRAILQATAHSTNFFTFADATPAVNGRITDIQCDVNGFQCNVIGWAKGNDSILLQNIKAAGLYTGPGCDTGSGPEASNIFIMECNFYDFTATNAGNAGGTFISTISNLVIMGCRFYNTAYGPEDTGDPELKAGQTPSPSGGVTQHVLRLQGANNCRVSDNYLGKSNKNKSVFLIHSPFAGTHPTDPEAYYFVVCDNYFEAGWEDLEVSNAIPANPQTGSASDKDMQNLIIERNFFYMGKDSASSISLEFADVVVRTNILSRPDPTTNTGYAFVTVTRASTNIVRSYGEIWMCGNSIYVEGVPTGAGSNLAGLLVQTSTNNPQGLHFDGKRFGALDNVMWSNGSAQTARIFVGGSTHNNGGFASLPVARVQGGVVRNNTVDAEVKTGDPGFANTSGDWNEYTDFVASAPGTDSSPMQSHPMSAIYDFTRVRYPRTGRKRGAFA